jgi:hypothetical protein
MKCKIFLFIFAFCVKIPLKKPTNNIYKRGEEEEKLNI